MDEISKDVYDSIIAGKDYISVETPPDPLSPAPTNKWDGVVHPTDKFPDAPQEFPYKVSKGEDGMYHVIPPEDYVPTVSSSSITITGTSSDSLTTTGTGTPRINWIDVWTDPHSPEREQVRSEIPEDYLKPNFTKIRASKPSTVKHRFVKLDKVKEILKDYFMESRLTSVFEDLEAAAERLDVEGAPSSELSDVVVKDISLPSRSIIESYIPERLRRWGFAYWLYDRGDHKTSAQTVLDNGTFSEARVDRPVRVRPILFIEASPKYKLGDTFKYGGVDFEIVDEVSLQTEVAFCVGDIGELVFNRNPSDGNTYDTSDIKKSLNQWLKIAQTGETTIKISSII